LTFITLRRHVGMVDFSDDEFTDTEQKTALCRHCKEYGFSVPLKNRIYPQGEPIPADHDQWTQCGDCGSIYAVYELEKESSIKDVLEITENPHDVSKNQFLGVDSRSARRKARKNKELFGDIQDSDLKRELASGQQLISYSESNAQ
jgi:hypothetical protein